ncbi:hypothetical protein MC885_019152 [Smutsia gigantea]|nr:hypothetical protein MC885_019152 [Smutsia gigantea]
MPSLEGALEKGAPSLRFPNSWGGARRRRRPRGPRKLRPVHPAGPQPTQLDFCFPASPPPCCVPCRPTGRSENRLPRVSPRGTGLVVFSSITASFQEVRFASPPPCPPSEASQNLLLREIPTCAAGVSHNEHKPAFPVGWRGRGSKPAASQRVAVRAQQPGALPPAGLLPAPRR